MASLRILDSSASNVNRSRLGHPRIALALVSICGVGCLQESSGSGFLDVEIAAESIVATVERRPASDEAPTLTFETCKISGFLDLSYRTISRPIIFKNCIFSDPIDLSHTTCKYLVFIDCAAVSLKGIGIHATGVVVSKGSTFPGGVFLGGSTISDNLVIDGAEIGSNKEGTSLSAVGSTISGSVVLRGGAQFFGTVNFDLADIGGDLKIRAPCTLSASKTKSASLRGAKIRGELLLGDKVSGRSCVTFSGKAIINRCVVGGAIGINGRFESPSPGEPVFVADSCSANRIYAAKCEFDGSVSFGGADVTKDFHVTKCKFELEEGQAFNLAAMTAQNVYLADCVVSGGGIFAFGVTSTYDLRLSNITFGITPKRDARVDLRSAKIGEHLDMAALAPPAVLDLTGTRVGYRFSPPKSGGEGTKFILSDVECHIFDIRDVDWSSFGEIKLNSLRYSSLVPAQHFGSSYMSLLEDLGQEAAFLEWANSLEKMGEDPSKVLKKMEYVRWESEWNCPMINQIVPLILNARFHLGGILIAAISVFVAGWFFVYRYRSQLLPTGDGEKVTLGRRQSFVYAADRFFPLTNLHLEDKFRPSGATGSFLLAIFSLAGWFFATLFVIAITTALKNVSG